MESEMMVLKSFFVIFIVVNPKPALKILFSNDHNLQILIRIGNKLWWDQGTVNACTQISVWLLALGIV